MLILNMHLIGGNNLISGLIKYRRQLPIQFRELGLKRIGGQLRKSAKLRVRRWSGDLKDSIETEVVDDALYFGANAPYAAAQELGFKSHLVHRSMPTFSGKKTIGRWMKEKGLKGNFLRVGGKKTSSRPFMMPAVWAVKPKIPNIMRQAEQRARQKSFRRKR